MQLGNVVLFGGTGFIGQHLTHHLLAHGLAQHVWLADLKPPNPASCGAGVAQTFAGEGVTYCEVDVRRPIVHEGLPRSADLVVNLAAVHREPGHQPHEYYETNLYGAEHVCAWAEGVDCRRVAFTSSIAPYGPTEQPKTETALTVPETPYGGSKLAAEKIHLAWLRGGPGRRLLILRPGVVFGPGEGGNVTRLVRAVLGRYFAYMGNRGTRKAGGYVKELCHVLWWALEQLEAHESGQALVNFTMDPPPSVSEYVAAICRVAGVQRRIPRVPYPALLAAAYGIEALARPLGLRQPVSPVRVRKLVRSNYIEPAVLRTGGYPWQYTLEEALADWRRERPEDWR